VLRFGVKKLRNGGDLIFSQSSLSGQEALKELLKNSFELVGFATKMTPLDLVYVFHFRKILRIPLLKKRQLATSTARRASLI